VSLTIRTVALRRAALTLSMVFGSAVAIAQRSMTSFGLYNEAHLLVPPSSVTVLPGAGTWAQPSILVASATTPVIQELQMDDGAGMTPVRKLQAPFAIGQIGVIDLDGDHKPSIVALATDGMRIAIMKPHARRADASVIELRERCQRFITADINGDGHPEILVFGKTMTGVSVILTQGRRLQEDQLLFPELSVSDMAVVDLNQDNVADVVLCHWLSNRLVVRLGIGGGVFSEQATLDLPAEPERIAVTTVSRRRMMRALVTLPEINGVAHILGFSTGELAVRDVVTLPARPTGVRFGLINDDYLPDMICATRAGFVVSIGTSALTFSGQTQFGVGADAESWTLADADGSGLTDLVYVQKPDRVAVLMNARVVPGTQSVYTYATGADPTGLFVGDYDGDGNADIVTANRGSHSLSLFRNLSDGTFDGQRTVDLKHAPEDLFEVSSTTRTRKNIIAVHPLQNALSVVQLPSGNTPARATVVQTGPDPEVVFAEAGASGESIRMVLHYRGAGPGESPIGVVQQLEGSRFVERSFRWPSQLSVSAVTWKKTTGPSGSELVMAVRDRRARTVTVAAAPAFEGFDARRLEPLFTVSDSLGVPRSLMAGRLTEDGATDLMITLGPPACALGVARGIGDHDFDLPANWQQGVCPEEPRDILLVDADGDGLADVVYNDRKENAIKVLYGDGYGAFLDPVTIVTGSPVSAFALGRFFGDSANDLVTTNSTRHTMSIHRGVFQR
jgi:hypothetical protein